MKKTLLALAVVLGTYLSANAVVTTEHEYALPSNQNDFNHAYYYTWGFKDVSDYTGGETITSAVLSFDSIRNWNDDDNTMYLWLLDRAKNGYESLDGYLRRVGDSGNSGDAFDGTAWSSTITKLKIGEYTDVTDGNSTENFSITFGTELLQELNDYIDNGNNFAIGLDPECHYYTEGVRLTLSWSPTTTPDAGASAWLLALSLGTFASLRRWMRK